jgi:DNA polymerase III epsilon subunit-like protein
VKNLTFFDLETTDKNAHQAEIVTAYFKTIRRSDFSVVDEFYQEVRPEVWSYEAEEIHGITKEVADSFESKETALPKIFEYVWKNVDDSIFLCYANPNNYGAFFYYDWGVLKQTAFDISDDFYYHWLERVRNAAVYSVYTLASEVLVRKKDVPNFRQESIAKYYEIEYNPHDAKEDVDALIEIYKRLLDEKANRPGQLL